MLINYSNPNDGFRKPHVYEPNPFPFCYKTNPGIGKMDHWITLSEISEPTNPLSNNEIPANSGKNDLEILAQFASNPESIPESEQRGDLTSSSKDLSEVEVIDSGSINMDTLEEFQNIVEIFTNFQSEKIDEYSNLLQKLISYVKEKSKIDIKIIWLAETIWENRENYFAQMRKQNIEKKCVFIEKVINFYCLLSKSEEKKEIQEAYESKMLFFVNHGARIIKRHEQRAKSKCNSKDLQNLSAFFDLKIAENLEKKGKYSRAKTRIVKALALNPNDKIKSSLMELQNSKKLTSAPKRKIDEVDSEPVDE